MPEDGRAMPRARTLVAGLVGLGLLAAAALYGPRAWAGLEVASAYSAKILCSCVFVSGREAADCRATDLGGFAFGLVDTSVDRDAEEVRASMLALRSARATYEAGRGCTLR